MTTGLIVLLVWVAALGAALGASWWASRAPILGRRVLVNLTDGSALRGVLTRQRGPWLTLQDAELFRVDNAGGGAVRMDGAVYLERGRVAFFQVLP